MKKKTDACGILDLVLLVVYDSDSGGRGSSALLVRSFQRPTVLLDTLVGSFD